MAPPATLREADDEGPVDLLELEERVRSGELSGEALLQYGPWTGEAFRRLDELPALAEAFQAPSARFAANLRQPGRSYGAALLSVVVMFAAFVQTVLGSMPTPEAVQLLEAVLRRGAVHWEGAVLDGAGWNVWSAHLLHAPGAPLVHALGNLVFLAYCGYRVERAWGQAGLLRVLASSLAVGSTSVLLFSDLPVLGSSILAFGLFGAQIAIGFRMGEAIPTGQRGRYGWGSLRAFLLFLGLTVALEYALVGFRGPSSAVSHLGHAGGLVGGVLGVVVGTPPVLRPSPAPRVGHLARSMLLGLAPALLGPLLGLSPWLAGQRWQDVAVEGTGMRLELPKRFAETPVTMAGLRGFAASRASDQAILVDQVVFSSYEALGDYDFSEAWGQRLGGAASPLPAPPTREGWASSSWEIEGDPGYIVVEHQLRQGLWVSRVAWVVPRDAPSAARERLYRRVLDTVQVADPPALVEERALYERNPVVPQRQYALARELMVAGRFAEADALLVPLLQREDGWQWDAARTRLRVFEVDPPTGAEVPIDWLLPFLEQAPPSDMELLGGGVAWLVRRGDCPRATATLDAWSSAIAEAEEPPLWVYEAWQAASKTAAQGCG